jgi:hypothetical protein
MGYTTDFIGHLDIHPPLNDAEQAYLKAYAASPRTGTEQSPYAVPGNPAAEEFEPRELPIATKPRRVRPRYSPADRPPGPWCGWVPGWCGDCLTFDGKEKFYEPVEWLRYLIDHFLRPNARAASSGLGFFEEFTFDHVLDGVIAGSRRDTCELFLIQVRDNQVAKTVLRCGDPQPWEAEPLPYQEEGDRWTSRRPPRAKPQLRLVSEQD